MADGSGKGQIRVADNQKSRLVIYHKNHCYGRYDLEDSRFIIGRTEDAWLQLEGDFVSRQHAEMFQDPFGRWWIHDLESRNGLQVNGESTKLSVVNFGDEIRIGKYRLLLEHHAIPGISASDASEVKVLSDSSESSIVPLKTTCPPTVDRSLLKALNDFSHTLHGEDNLSQRRSMLCELMVESMFRGQASMMIDSSSSDPQILCKAIRSDTDGSDLYISRKLLKAVSNSDEPLLASTDPSASNALEFSQRGSERHLAAIACPVCEIGRSRKVLYVTYKEETGKDDWIAPVELAVQQYSADNAVRVASDQKSKHERIEHDLSRAHEIQQRLLPRVGLIKGLDYSIHFEPCHWIGGDYVDVLFNEATNRCMILIADVCGKGLSAALVAASLHALVQGSYLAGTNLVGTMNILNRHLRTYFDARAISTAVAMDIDLNSGTIDYVNAGHPAPIIIRPDGTRLPLPSPQHYPLGITDDPIDSVSLQIDPGSWIAMFTDGLMDLQQLNGDHLGLKGAGTL
ncbi:MAG: SpoIIE family protein phosphatase, partial [Planctomycetota bacterium]|nr:SpoIIE family protein phosphatase [Planctomycetota bacterium]